jgi:N-acyl-D-amino-acid deacylase
MKPSIASFLLILLLAGCQVPDKYDLLIRNGMIYDGSGSPPYSGDLAVRGDTIVQTGRLRHAKGKVEIDARGLAVAPGFINILSWANESLIEDGKSQSDIRQGVTLEVFGEGESWGPLNEKMKHDMKQSQGDILYDIEWTTLGEFLDYLVRKGVTPNIASFVGAATLRTHVIGHENRPATVAEIDSMQALVRQAMEEGAMGIGSALEYVPGAFAGKDELTALCKEASRYGGMYISHLRNEGENILPSLDELIFIAKDAGIRSEIYHLKQAGKSNWHLYNQVTGRIDSARKAGLEITADMYTYNACATGLDIIMPTWVQEGGYTEWVRRLKTPGLRKQAGEFIRKKILESPGSAENVLFTGFRIDSLRKLTGKTLAQVAAERNKPAEETAMDLVVENGADVGTVYFNMSEENVKKQIALPWMCFCSDAGSLATEGVFLKSGTHPRAYGSFARLLGKYVREEKVIPLEEAIRKLTSLPAGNLKLVKRGSLKPGYFADIVIFDPTQIRDNATFQNPHQYATGMVHVFVNGVQVLKEGEHTSALPGRVVRGPGWNRKQRVPELSSENNQ